MIENYLLPFCIGFLIIIIPIIIWAIFCGYLYVTLGSWSLVEDAESFKKRAIHLIMFLSI